MHRPAPSRNQPSRKLGRPLGTAITEATLAATARILAEGGYARFTIDRIAESAGVSRASILRRWPDKLDLVVELFTTLNASVPPPDTGDLVSDLIAHFNSYIAGVPTPGGLIMPALIAESFNNPELASILRAAYILPRRARAVSIFERARERGELTPDVDPAIVVDIISGYVWHRRFVTGQTLDAAVARRFIDVVLHGVGSRSRG